MNETIINGIDVSECRFYEPKAQKMTCHEETITKPCESTPICYYKLLQKSYIEIQRLQEENKELKEMLSKEPKAMQAFQIAYSGLKKDNEVLWGMVKDYKTALEEIRNIAETPIIERKRNEK